MVIASAVRHLVSQVYWKFVSNDDVLEGRVVRFEHYGGLFGIDVVHVQHCGTAEPVVFHAPAMDDIDRLIEVGMDVRVRPKSIANTRTLRAVRSTVVSEAEANPPARFEHELALSDFGVRYGLNESQVDRFVRSGLRY